MNARSLLISKKFPHTSSFHLFRNQDEQFVLSHFVVVLCHQASNNHHESPQVVLVLSTKLPSLVSSSDSTCSHSRITPSSMLGMSRCNMVFPTATTLGRWLSIGLTPFESAESHPTVVSYASSTIFDRFVCTRVAGFRCARCAYLSQDINVLHQVPWQFPSERVVEPMSQVCCCKDDVASIRVCNCNMALTVNFACADQSFEDVCLLTLESHSIPVAPLSRKPPRSEMSSPKGVRSAEITASVSYVHLNQPLGSKCGDLTGVSNSAKSRELARAGCGCGSTTAGLVPDQCAPPQWCLFTLRSKDFACFAILHSSNRKKRSLQRTEKQVRRIQETIDIQPHWSRASASISMILSCIFAPEGLIWNAA